MKRYIEGFAQSAEAVRNYQYELDDLSERLREQLEELDFNPRELDEIEDRLETIAKLKKIWKQYF